MKFKNLFTLFKIINQKEFLIKQLKKISFLSFLQPFIELGIIFLIVPFISNFFKKNNLTYLDKFIAYTNLDVGNDIFVNILIAIILLIIFYILLIIIEKKVIDTSYDFFSKTKSFTLKYILNQSFKNIFKSDVANQVSVVSHEISVLVIASLSFANLIKAISLFLTFSTVLLFLNFKITLIVLFFLTLINIILFYLFKNKFSEYGKKDIQASLKANSIIYNIITNTFSVKQYSIEESVMKIASNSFYGLQNIRSEYLFLQKLIKFILEIIIFSSMLVMLIIFSNNNSFFQENITFLSILVYSIFRLFPIFSQFNTNFGSLIKLEKGSETIKKVLENLHQDETKNIIFSNDLIRKNILNIKNYNYKIENNNLIENVNLSLNNNNIYFLVGSNGSGKSSFLKSLININDYKGEIFYENIELQNIDINKLFQITKYCPQNDIIFDDTIAFNILLSNEKPEDMVFLNKIIQTCELSKLTQSRNIFEYEVGQNGYKISGGEKQKILLARALYTRPSFLYLDESFSNISETDTKKICEKLKEILPETLIIIISHQVPNMEKIKLLKIENKQINEY